MRDAEGFVEIQMANISSEIAGAAETDLRIHIRAVHVNLTASGVDEIANITDAFLENTVRRGIGDHHGSELVAVEVGLRAEVGEINIAVGVTGHGDNLHSDHHRAGGVRSMRGSGDEADRAVGLAARMVVGADGEESGIFSLRTGIGLERDGGETGDLGEPCLQLVRHFFVSA